MRMHGARKRRRGGRAKGVAGKHDAGSIGSFGGGAAILARIGWSFAPAFGEKPRGS
jgi:hypothetical protein